jgi:hypothetical protein
MYALEQIFLILFCMAEKNTYPPDPVPPPIGGFYPMPKVCRQVGVK